MRREKMTGNREIMKTIQIRTINYVIRNIRGLFVSRLDLPSCSASTWITPGLGLGGVYLEAPVPIAQLPNVYLTERDSQLLCYYGELQQVRHIDDDMVPCLPMYEVIDFGH